MAQHYDVSLKELFLHSKGLVAQRLFGGTVVEWVNVEQPKVTNVRVDLLARMEDGRLRHVEFESKNEPEMARRQADYYMGFWRLLGQHVEQVLLYVGRERLRMSPVFQTPSLEYRFEILDIRDFDGEPLLASGDWGDNVLALLTRVDQERVLERVEAQIRKLGGEEQQAAANILILLSGIIGIEAAVAERLTMIDVMENKVLGPAILKGRAEGERILLMRLLAKRFGEVTPVLVARIANASEEELFLWSDRVLTASSLADVFVE